MIKRKNKLFAVFGMAFAITICGMLCGFTTASASAEEVETVPCPHEYETVNVEPSCNEMGYTLYTCKLCGDSYKDNYTEAKGHTYSEIVVEATCTHRGYTTHFCKECGYEYSDNYVSPLGHSFVEEVINPSCTTEGYTVHTCETCGYFYADNVELPFGHSYKEEVTEPTCMECGYTTHICETCGDEYTDSETEAKGHDYKESIVAPTCVAYGFTIHQCSECGSRYITDYVKPLGHDYEVTVVEATPEEIGYTQHKCKICEYSYLSDFVRSGEQPEIPEEPETPETPEEPEIPETPEEPEIPEEPTHTHEYVFSYEVFDNEKKIVVSNVCSCGETDYSQFYIKFTPLGGESENISVENNGEADYSAISDGVYEVEIFNGTKSVGYLILGIGYEEPPEHTHIYEVGYSVNQDEKTITVEYACGCGEKNTSPLQVTFTDGNGNRYDLTANDEGKVDYSEVESGSYVVEMYNELGETVKKFTVEVEKEKEPTPPEEWTEPDDTPDEPKNPDKPTDSKENGKSGLLTGMLITLGVLAAGAVATLIIIKKRSNKDKDPEQKQNSKTETKKENK